MSADRLKGKAIPHRLSSGQAKRSGWASFGLGAAALGAGTWLYIKGNPAKVVIVPTGDGLQLSAGF